MSALAIEATCEGRLRRMTTDQVHEARALIAVEDAAKPDESVRDAIARLDATRAAREAELREIVPVELALARTAYVARRAEAEHLLGELLNILPDCAAARSAYVALHGRALSLDCADHVRERPLAPDVHALLLHIGNA